MSSPHHAPVVLIGTFNMNQRPIEQDLSDWLATHPSLSSSQDSIPSPISSPVLSPDSASANDPLPTTSTPIMPDIVAVALQEFVPYPDAFIHDTYNIKEKIDELAKTILRTLHRTCPGYRFSLVSQSAQVGMTLFILSRDGSMTEYIEKISNASVGTGPLNMGNKGAIATKISLRWPLDPTKGPFHICFINAHLSAHLNKIKKRNEDYLAICRRMVFTDDKENQVQGLLKTHQARLVSSFDPLEDPQDDEDLYQLDNDSRPLLPKNKKKKNPKATRSSQLHQGRAWEESIFECDYIFWAGDLNYRLDLSQSDGSLNSHKKKKTTKKEDEDPLLSRPTLPELTASEIVRAIKAGHFRQLYSHDQLSAQRKTMNVFKDFREAPLAFAPTFKFRMGSSEYDISKRVPAWTDRVLWFVHPKDSASADEAKEDELDAWDEHSEGLGSGSLPMEPPLGKSRTRNYRTESLSLGSQGSARSRGTFSSLTKKGGSRVVIDAGLFQPPLPAATSHDHGSSFYQAPMSTAVSSTSLASLSSRNNSASMAGQGPFSQSPASSFHYGSSPAPSTFTGKGVCSSPLLIHYYASHPSYKSSDHKPVSALFTLLPHNLAAHQQPSPYGIDPAWRQKNWLGKKLTTILGHFLRWGFLVGGLAAFFTLLALVRRHLQGW